MMGSNIASTLHNPNGIVLNSYRPVLVGNPVLQLSSSVMGVCQNPDARSKVQKSLQPHSASTSKVSEEFVLLHERRLVAPLRVSGGDLL
jgi:hypothetical protein